MVGVVLWLLIGAAVNVVITMGIAVRYDAPILQPVPRQDLQTTPQPKWSFPLEPNAQHAEPIGYSWYWAYDMQEAQGPLLPPGDDRFFLEYMVGFRYGFPFRALSQWTSLQPLVLPPYHGSVLVSLPFVGERWIPLAPLWPGFALNTVFYAALAWGLWQLPLAIRLRRRRRKGLCVRCGYDFKGLGGLALGSPCPECGSAR